MKKFPLKYKKFHLQIENSRLFHRKSREMFFYIIVPMKCFSSPIMTQNWSGIYFAVKYFNIEDLNYEIKLYYTDKTFYREVPG